MLIDWFTVAAQITNFLVLVWLLKRFLYAPILNAMASEKNAFARLSSLRSGGKPRPGASVPNFSKRTRSSIGKSRASRCKHDGRPTRNARAYSMRRGLRSGRFARNGGRVSQPSRPSFAKS